MGVWHMNGRSNRPPPVVEIRKSRALDRDEKALFEAISGGPQQASNRLVTTEADTAIADAFRRAGYDKIDIRKAREEERKRLKQERLDALRKTAAENQAKRVTTEDEMDSTETTEKPRMPDWNDLADGKVKAGEKYIAPNGSVLVAGEALPAEMLKQYRQLASGEFETVTDEQVAEAEVMASRAKERRLQTPAQRRGPADGATMASASRSKAALRGWESMTPDQQAEKIRKMHHGRAKPHSTAEEAAMITIENGRREAIGLLPLGRLMTKEERKEYARKYSVDYNRKYRERIRSGEIPPPDSWHGPAPGRPARKRGGYHAPKNLPAPIAAAPEDVPVAKHGQVQHFHEWTAPLPSTIGIEVDGVRYQPSFEIEDDVPLPPPPGMTVWPFAGLRVGQSFKVPIDHRGASAIVKEVEKQAKKHAPEFEFLIAPEPGHVRCWRRK
jgi:hypothetical protein